MSTKAKKDEKNQKEKEVEVNRPVFSRCVSRV